MCQTTWNSPCCIYSTNKAKAEISNLKTKKKVHFLQYYEIYVTGDFKVNNKNTTAMLVTYFKEKICSFMKLNINIFKSKTNEWMN